VLAPEQWRRFEKPNPWPGSSAGIKEHGFTAQQRLALAYTSFDSDHTSTTKPNSYMGAIKCLYYYYYYYYILITTTTITITITITITTTNYSLLYLQTNAVLINAISK